METFTEDLVAENLEGKDEAVMEYILGCVSDMAKPCVNKAIDYTLLVVLLILQFMRCSPPSTDELLDKATSGDLNATAIYSCDLSESQSLFSGLVIAAVVIGVLYGILASVIIWIHASKMPEDVKRHPLIDTLYKCTDKILVIDTALEIPISFFWTPKMALLLWSLFSACVAGIIFLSRTYADQVAGDQSAIGLFNTSAFLVVLSLYKLTGELSQYWVQYSASTSGEVEAKYEEYVESGPTATITNNVMSIVNKVKGKTGKSETVNKVKGKTGKSETAAP